jgi:hypothetical protein
MIMPINYKKAVCGSALVWFSLLGCQNNLPSSVVPVDKSEAVCFVKIETFNTEYREPEPPVWVPPANFRELQLALARVCVSESGFQIRTLDCRLIYETLRYRSVTGELTMGIMQAYSTRAFNRSRTDPRHWIAFLNPEFTQPRGWTENITVPWSARRADWRRVYEFAGYLLRYTQEYPCTLRVHHWGARGFRYWQHRRSGWIPIDCGEETANTFWHVPSRNNPETRLCLVAERVCR